MRRSLPIAAAAFALALGTVLAAPPARAGVPGIPDDVSTWFKTEAPDIVRAQCAPSRGEAPDPINGPLIFPFASSVGTPVSMMVWGDEFLQAADPTADMLVPLGVWIAPISAQGQPVGVIDVSRSGDGELGWMTRTNTEMAAALMAARPQDVIVSDGRNGLFIVTDKTARQYGQSRWGIMPTAGSLKQLQGAVLAFQAEMAAATEALGEVPTGGGVLNFGQYVADHPEGPLAPARVAPAPWRIAAATLGGALVVGASCAALCARGRREEATT